MLIASCKRRHQSLDATCNDDAQLWPLYLFFGNESKYRRSRPSSNLCEHIAYFQKLPDTFKDFAARQTGGGSVPSAAFRTHCSREVMHAQWMVILDDEFLEAWTHGIVGDCCDGVKRRFFPRIFTYSADYPEKILIAGIRNLGHCPCPRCLLPLKQVHHLGTPEDMMQRITMARIDDEDRRTLVASARKLIYEQCRSVVSSNVEDLLREKSLVPNTNAFSQRLGHLGFDLHAMLVVDLMHDFEIGGWRSLFIHLLRILESHNPVHLCTELDRRYRQVPTFGRDTIRRFSSNCSELKKMAARDFEDLLQCAIPVFEGLLPEPHNTRILRLLFTLAHWHALAKLRLHTDFTLEILDNVTSTLGSQLREFKDTTCSVFVTHELDRELRARTARENSKKRDSGRHVNRTNTGTTVFPLTTPAFWPHPAVTENAFEHRSNPPSSAATSFAPPSVSLEERSQDTSAAPVFSIQPAQGSLRDVFSRTAYAIGPQRHHEPGSSSSKEKQKGRLLKTLNLNTYKFHALGDYSRMIRMYGTTDSYTTELGESEHRRSKSRYARTSRKHFIHQITQIERRQNRIRHIREHHAKLGTIPAENVPCPPEMHHNIGKSQNHAENILRFVQKHAGDPAIKDFVPRLKDHLLPRIKAMLQEESMSTDGSSNLNSTTTQLPGYGLANSTEDSAHGSLERDFLFFKSDSIYEHRLVKFNYTRYDVRRAQDVINPYTQHRDIMLLQQPDNTHEGSKHAFSYARVIGIFHANVIYTGPGMLDYKPRRLDFLWVRWFEYSLSRSVSWTDCSLDPVHFPPVASEHAFGFVDPRDVLRGCHTIPRYVTGKMRGGSVGLSRCADDSQDWRGYYINRFVDCDMVVRYHWGLGVGHVYSHTKANGQTSEEHAEERQASLGTHSVSRIEPVTSNQVVPSATGLSARPIVHAELECDRDDDSESDVDHNLRDVQDDEWEQSDDDGQPFNSGYPSDDDEQMAMEEMYGFDLD